MKKTKKRSMVKTCDKILKNADEVFVGGIDNFLQHSIKGGKRIKKR